MAESTISDSEHRAISFHAQSCPTAENLWVDGINLLLRGLDPLSGQKTTSDEQSVLLALVIRAWNTLYCAHDLAIRGYYSQALNLLRTPLELGPAEDAEAFNLCTSESATIITALLEAVDNLRRLMGVSVYEVWPNYKRRVIKWQKPLIMEGS